MDSVTPARDRRLRVIEKSPARLILTMKELLPEEEFTSGDGDVVIASFDGIEPSQIFTARWKLTAADVHDIVRGEVTVEQLHAD